MVNAKVWTIIMCKCCQTITKDLDLLFILHISTHNHKNQCKKEKNNNNNTTLKARRIFGLQTLCELICIQGDDCGSCVKSPSQESPDLIYGKWFPPKYKVVNHALLRFLKTFGQQTIIMVKIPQFQTAAWKYPPKAELKVLCVTRGGFSVFIFMTRAVYLWR